ncbi:hypothetical protein SAMN04488029_1850 [Reichenbachiella faecimaris]|uniref:Uncharacterized protein n=1 Tax=Reichenbachiella faecimaris TaxID=692418 RepID=A0A1W2GC78_REIFA|nr:hypothetical protein SAMN04488029_1850 [Reichenbachiella faecimaris]
MQLIRSVLTRKNQFFNTILYGLIAVLFSMCNAGELDFNDIELPPYTPKLVAPIGSTTYTITDLIGKIKDPNIEITENSAKQLSIAYRDTTTFNDYLSLITLEDVSNPGVIDASLTPIPGSPSNQDVDIDPIDLSFEYTSPNNEELDSVKYTAGTITLDIQNGYSSAIEYELTLNDIVDLDTGNPMVLSGTLPRSGTDNVSAQLTNHKTIIDQISDQNIFSGEFSGTLKVLTGDFVNGTEFISYTLTITGAEFSEIYGWFGDKTIDIESRSIDIDFFEGISENGLVFNNPQLNFYINNSFGVPMGLNFDDVSSSNANGTVVNLSGSVTSSPQFVRAPSTSQVGTPVTSIINVDESNSNMRDLLAISPNLFTISLTAEANFNNDNDTDEADRNFVSSESIVEVVTELNLPLNVKLTDVTRDFPTGIEGFDFEEADTLRLVIETINQLPFDGTMDMQFLAADSSVLYENLDVLFFTSSEVPVSGKIENPTVTTSIVPVYREGGGYEQLLEASILNLVIRVNSFEASDDTFVKIFSDYELIITVGTEVSINYEL